MSDETEYRKTLESWVKALLPPQNFEPARPPSLHHRTTDAGPSTKSSPQTKYSLRARWANQYFDELIKLGKSDQPQVPSTTVDTSELLLDNYLVTQDWNCDFLSGPWKFHCRAHWQDTLVLPSGNLDRFFGAHDHSHIDGAPPSIYQDVYLDSGYYKIWMKYVSYKTGLPYRPDRVFQILMWQNFNGAWTLRGKSEQRVFSESGGWLGLTFATPIVDSGGGIIRYEIAWFDDYPEAVYFDTLAGYAMKVG